jgi:hypothetical protein
LKQFVISVGLFLVSSLANANLVQHTITQTTPHANSAVNAVMGHALSPLAHTHLLSDKPSKTEETYSTLFEYSSHINQTIDHSGLSVFWNHALISTAITAAQSQQQSASAHVAEDSELLGFVANSLNDDYVAANNPDTRINEVPLPAAIWLFSSAIMLFGFARRGTV